MGRSATRLWAGITTSALLLGLLFTESHAQSLFRSQNVRHYNPPAQRIAASPGDGTNTTLTVAFANNPNVNDLVIVLFKIATTTITLSSFADSNGNNFSLSAQSPFIDNPDNAKVWVLYLVAPSNASKTLTFTTSAPIGVNLSNLCAVDVPVNGKTPVIDTSAYTPSGVGTAITGPSITPAGPDEFMYSMAFVGGSWVSTNSPWTASGAATPDGDNDGYIVSSTSAATAVNQTQDTNTGWVAVSSAFK